MEIKKIAAAVTLAAAACAVVPAVASAGPVAGSYTLADLGQGGWTGGPLRSDGTIGGGGAVSFSTPAGQFIEKVVSGTWSSPSPGLVTLTLNLVGVSAIAPPTDTFTITAPVTNQPFKAIDPDSGGPVLIRIRLF